MQEKSEQLSKKGRKFSLSPKIGWYFPPFGGFPFNYLCINLMGLQPSFGSFYHLEKFFGLSVAFQFGFAFLFLHPQNGVITIGIYHLIGYASLLHQGQGMNNAKEFADVIGAVNRSEMKYGIARL